MYFNRAAITQLGLGENVPKRFYPVFFTDSLDNHYLVQITIPLISTQH